MTTIQRSNKLMLFYPLYTGNPLNRYFGKQLRPRWNAALCCISSGSTRFAKIKTTFWDKNTSLFRKVYLWPLKEHNGQSYANSINMYRKIHQNTKGLNKMSFEQNKKIRKTGACMQQSQVFSGLGILWSKIFWIQFINSWKNSRPTLSASVV